MKGRKQENKTNEKVKVKRKMKKTYVPSNMQNMQKNVSIRKNYFLEIEFHK